MSVSFSFQKSEIWYVNKKVVKIDQYNCATRWAYSEYLQSLIFYLMMQKYCPKYRINSKIPYGIFDSCYLRREFQPPINCALFFPLFLPLSTPAQVYWHKRSSSIHTFSWIFSNATEILIIIMLPSVLFLFFPHTTQMVYDCLL